VPTPASLRVLALRSGVRAHDADRSTCLTRARPPRQGAPPKPPCSGNRPRGPMLLRPWRRTQDRAPGSPGPVAQAESNRGFPEKARASPLRPTTLLVPAPGDRAQGRAAAPAQLEGNRTADDAATDDANVKPAHPSLPSAACWRHYLILAAIGCSACLSGEPSADKTRMRTQTWGYANIDSGDCQPIAASYSELTSSFDST